MLRIKSSWLKMIIVFSVIVTCVTGTVISSYAAEVSDDANTAEDTNNYEVKVYESDAIPISVEIISADYDAPTDLEGIGTISVQQYLSINDIVVPLYPVFDDMEEAINNISEVSSNVISDIASCYELDMLSEDNWHKYQLSLADYADDDAMESDDNYSYEYAMLDQFFDIYENYECNQEIINMAMEASSIDDLFETDEFRCSISYYYADEFCEEVANSIDKTLEDYQVDNEEISSYSTSTAVTYAKKYAASYNTAYGYISGADCTNFVSQILYNGGKYMNSTWTTYKLLGTWHYSSVWAKANSFANYWGVDYKYSSHTSFSNKLKKGDYITEDKANDGSWDHMGFVTAIGSKTSSGYTNYQVAQHTKNYLAWASSSTCGWDTLSTNYPNVRYGIIRI